MIAATPEASKLEVVSLPRKARKTVVKKTAVKKTAGKKKAPRCSRCQRAIHVPAGWSGRSAVRRHYWAKHRDVMLPGGKRGDA